MARTERLYLLDSMALAYRAHFAYLQRPLMTSKGEPTSAVFGFVSFLDRILQQEFPDHIAAVFDTAEPTFRHKAYAAYKATREEMPEELSVQIPVIKEVVRAYNIPVIELPGYEADDIIGTLAAQADREGALTFVVSADKDMMQLVTERVKMYRPSRSGGDLEVVGIPEVKERFGVKPSQVVDVLALMGDSSDNVPGVKGIGEKTAIPLIQQFGSVEKLYDRLADVAQRGTRSKLEASRDLAFLSKMLVTIDTAVPLPISFHDLKAFPADISQLLRLFDRLEFRSLVQRLRERTPSAESAPEPEETHVELATVDLTPPADISSDPHEYHLVTTESELQDLCKQLSGAPRLVFDTETTSTDALTADLVGISIAVRAREAFYIPVRSSVPGSDGDLFTARAAVPTSRLEGLPLAAVIAALKPILEDRTITKIGHNLKYDMLVLSRYGVAVTGEVFDTMIASYILRADAQHGMDPLALDHLRYQTVTFDELVGTGRERKDIRDVAMSRLSDYSCEDSDITYRLYEFFSASLEESGMRDICTSLDFPLVPVLARMEEAGITIDSSFLAVMSKELELQLNTLTQEIHGLAGSTFNINSTQQLADVLFTKLNLPPVRKTKTGFSTDVAVLESLKGQHPIVDKLLEFRQLTKLKSTYVDALPRLVHPQDGRVHTSFNQTVALTGRLSSSDPNLQNIPIRTDIGRSIRKAFIAADRQSCILSADYSQIELRIMAHVSSDPGLIEAFRNKEDIHSTTAARVFGVPLGEVTKDMRRKAKEVNFGIMYGIGPFGLATRLEISQNEAKEIIGKYFTRFPKVREYIEETKEQAKKLGYVSTMMGRRRYLPEIRSSNQTVRANAERQAINMPIQGTAADLIKSAMIRIDAALLEKRLRTRMVLQVHDELVFDMPEAEESVLRELVSRHMTGAMTLSVPLEVDMGVGNNWLEAH